MIPEENTPRVAITLGDPAGIGSELVAKLIDKKELCAKARILLIADPWLWEKGCRLAGVTHHLPHIESLEAISKDWAGVRLFPVETIGPESVNYAEVSGAGGKSQLSSLGTAVDLANSGRVDAVLFAPLNKQAMHLGGIGVEDELHWVARRIGYTGPLSEFNVLDKLWTSRITSHVPLKRVPEMLNERSLLEAARMTREALVRSGIQEPRIGMAALNPHGGDGGVFGREEIDIIAPAIQKARAEGIAIDGPFPSDTIFLKAFAGDYNAIITMYHDQGQIAMKLKGFDRGVTVLGGLPIVVTTAAHGTAYDIAGQGIADPKATEKAFILACRMGATRKKERQVEV